MTKTFNITALNAPVDGYRLVHLEVQNFGFYHGAHSFPLSADGAVFTGENGAGKSTALDALRVLFFEQPAFNSASSEQKRARNIESYYLGTFGEGEDTNASGEVSRKRKILRGYNSPIGATVVLAQVATRAGQVLTFARMLHMPSPQAYNWRNIVADIPLAMSDILPFGSVREIQRRVARPGTLVTDNNSSYFQRVATSFGFKDRATARPAFQMLEKAIGAKTIPSLEKFAQDHIFPFGDLEEVCGSVASSLHAVRDILDELQTDRAKLAQLKKITASFDVIEKNEALHADAADLARHSEAFEHILESLRWSSNLSDVHAKFAPLLAEQHRIEAQIETLRASIPALEAAYRAAGGDRIDGLEGELRVANADLAARQARRTPYERLVSTAGLGDLPQAPDVWAALPRKLDAKITESGRDLATAQAADDAATGQIAIKKAHLGELEAELANMKDTGSALGRKLVTFRAALAEDLGISAEDVPFLGEMWEVQDKKWEGAANRALGEVATHILVPGHFYEDAIRVMRSGHWGTKIDLRNAEERSGRAWRDSPASANALSTKIDVKPGHPLFEAAQALLNGAADYACVSTDAELKGQRAITMDGTVSLGTGHARKDDRNAVGDRSKWVIGWSNEARRKALEEDVAVLEDEIKTLETTRSEARSGVAAHRRRLESATEARENFADFATMDVDGAAAQVQHVLKQIDAIRTGSLEEADKALKDARGDLEQAQKDLLVASKKVASAETSLETIRKSLHAAHHNARQAQQRSGMPVPLRVARILANIGLGNTEIGGETIDAHPGAGKVRAGVYFDKQPLVDKIRKDKEDRMRLAQRRIHENSGVARDHISKFFELWPAENGKTLSRKIDDPIHGRTNRQEWRDRRAKIEFHDIKSLESTIESRDRTTIFAALPKVTGSQQDYHREIMSLQTGINQVLSRTIYDKSKGSYARLEIQRKSNPVIGEFQRLLKECSTNLTELTTEEVYRRAGRFVEWVETTDPKLREERLGKALDMRRWYTIRLVEYRPIENPKEGGPTEEVLDILSGAASKSGGEAERLSSFFLGAGVSHAFGTCDPFRETPPLQLFIIDEAFKHCTDDTARGALTFLERLGLQLLLASPIEKVSAFEGFADRFYVVSKEENQSFAQPIAYEDITEEMADAESQMVIGEAWDTAMTGGAS